MPNNTPTKQATMLAEALVKRGVEIKTECPDGHKHVDICIPKHKIYIEIDGLHHETNPQQIIRDFTRDYFSSKEGFLTKHITNHSIENYLEEIADGIARAIKEYSNKMGENLKK